MALMEDANRKAYVPNDSRAKLMYYVRCMSHILELGPNFDPYLKRLVENENYSLRVDEEEALIRICLMVTPKVLLGTCIFIHEGLCDGGDNKFYELASDQAKLLTNNYVRDVFIAGQNKSVKKIMVCKESWLQDNILHPLETIKSRDQLETERRKQELRLWRLEDELENGWREKGRRELALDLKQEKSCREHVELHRLRLQFELQLRDLKIKELQKALWKNNREELEELKRRLREEQRQHEAEMQRERDKGEQQEREKLRLTTELEEEKKLLEEMQKAHEEKERQLLRQLLEEQEKAKDAERLRQQLEEELRKLRLRSKCCIIL